MEKVTLLVLTLINLHHIQGSKYNTNQNHSKALHDETLTAKYSLGVNGLRNTVNSSFPSVADTLAYVDALKNSNFSQWRSLEQIFVDSKEYNYKMQQFKVYTQVVKKAGAESCSEAANTSVLTALYLLGLFNLCTASPSSCCVPPVANNRRRRSNQRQYGDYLTKNATNLSLEHLSQLPHVSTSEGGRIPIDITVVEQVRQLWDSNPRLVSSLTCKTATESVRSSFISLSGVASGIILAYSIAQLNQCYPDISEKNAAEQPKIWFFPITSGDQSGFQKRLVRSLPTEIPVSGEDDPDDGCNRVSVPMQNGQCAQLMSTHVCPYQHWVLLNKQTRKGECIRNLCPKGRVFVESDQLCHDVTEPGYCPHDQRLYLTSWGEAVCDCNDGSFPAPDGQCHRLYEPAYCHKKTLLQFHQRSKALACLTDQCLQFNENLQQNHSPFAKYQQGDCYQMGTIGPCEEHQRYGFDVESLSTACVSLKENSLISPRRSYTYSHISFPTETNDPFPHYEVSYVIVNGSTWELLMRTVGREKRDTGTDSRNYYSVKFLDTRDFPTDMIDILPSLETFGLYSHEDTTHSTKDDENITKPRRKLNLRRFKRKSVNGKRHLNRRQKKKLRTTESYLFSLLEKQNKTTEQNVDELQSLVSTEYKTVQRRTKNSNITIHPVRHKQNFDHSDRNQITIPSPVRGVNSKSYQTQSNINKHLLFIVQDKGKQGLRSVKNKAKNIERNLHQEKTILMITQNQIKLRKKTRRSKKLKKSRKKNKRYRRRRLKKRRRKSVPSDNRRSSSGSLLRILLRSKEHDPTAQKASNYGSKLPDYLRNRGRRQAIGRRGIKSVPGIINAPILNQCRPGAKRDYNGHCRPKIIPQDDSPTPRIKNREPSSPLIKCKGKARLDSRGVCNKIYNGLG